MLGVTIIGAAVHAQTPTETFIRIHHILENDQPPDISISPATVKISGGLVCARAKATAKTMREAKREAMRRAYSQAARVSVLPLKEFASMLSDLASATSELRAIKARIVSERQEGDRSTVEIEITQEKQGIENNLAMMALSNYRVVVLLPESIDGIRVPVSKVETELVGSLSGKMFKVYDWNYVAQQKPLAGFVKAILSEQNQPSIEIGTRFLANLIIAGHIESKFSQETAGITSYIATANIRVVKADTGQILTAMEASQKGFGQDRTQAAREALVALADVIAKKIPDNILAHLEEYPVTIRIAVPMPDDGERIADYLNNMVGVTSVKRVDTADGISFRVISKDKPALLGQQIDESKQYRVVEYGRLKD